MTAPVTSQDYFNSSRLKVIAMITAATVAVGALGAIAGVAFDPDPVTQDNLVQPGSGGAQLAPQELKLGAGRSKPYAVAPSPAAVRDLDGGTGTSLPQALSTTLPSPIGTASPGSGGFTTGPSTNPTQAPTGGTDGGSKVSLSSTGVDVFLPDGWTTDFSDEKQAYLSDGQGSFAFAFTYQDDPSTAAGDVITANLDGLLPADSYTQLQTSDVSALQPLGAVVSLAGLEYEALWVDNQGSASIHGQIYVGVRQDGTVLGILIEHIPAEDFESTFDDLVPILDNSFGRFAGVS